MGSCQTAQVAEARLNECPITCAVVEGAGMYDTGVTI